MLESIAKTSLLVLGILVSIGGVAGFLKAKSKASLTAGIVSGALLAAAYSISERNSQQGLIFGGIVSIILCIVFSLRLKKTGKFMPSGLLLALCCLEVILIAAATQLH